MTDVVFIAIIGVFFLAAALLVQALGRVVADSGDDAGLKEALPGPEPAGDIACPRRLARAGTRRAVYGCT